MMSRILHLLVCLICVASLSAASVARGHGPQDEGGLTRTVICADGGPQLIVLDASGNKVAGNAPAQSCARCPDCLLHAGLAVAGVAPVPHPLIPGRAAALPPYAQPDGARNDPAPFARGPPQKA